MKPSPFRLGFFISQKTPKKIVVRIVVNHLKKGCFWVFCSNIVVNLRHPKGNTERRLKIFLCISIHILYIPLISFLKYLIDTVLLDFIHTEPLRRPVLKYL